ncbi:MAG TPA: SDR family NAD(P)-dependent oxidoreductase, partial [bacterium]
MTRHDERVVLITGGARGLGWGIARTFGLAGARVCVTDIHSDDLARCARDLAADGTDHLTCLSDVANLTACAEVTQMIIERWG